MALDADRAEELFGVFGPVRLKRMFGGCGIYSGETVFALEIRDVIYLKSDETTDALFEREGCEPFAYDRKDGRHVVTSYRRAPERLLEEPDEMAQWARRSLAIVRASRKPKPKRKAAKRA